MFSKCIHILQKQPQIHTPGFSPASMNIEKLKRHLQEQPTIFRNKHSFFFFFFFFFFYIFRENKTRNFVWIVDYEIWSQIFSKKEKNVVIYTFEWRFNFITSKTYLFVISGRLQLLNTQSHNIPFKIDLKYIIYCLLRNK